LVKNISVKIPANTPLVVSLRWGANDALPVGRLAYRDHIALFEYDGAFLETGLEISPIRHRAAPRLQRPYDTHVFDGLAGVFHDSLPDGWGHLFLDRRAATAARANKRIC